MHFTSYHPRHVFRSIISSQALRYRRVINNDKILNCRLEELKEAFRNSAYPDELIDELVDPVKKYKRSLEYKSSSEKEKSFKVPWVTTFGAGYEEAKQKSKKINQTLSLSSTWKNEQGPIIMPVCRRAPNLKDTLFQRKALALKPQTASPVPCSAYRMNKRGRKCQCCSMLSDSVEVHSNNIVVQSAGGGCKSSNIIYCVKCLLCSNFNCYVGKTVTTLHKRLNEHRASFSSLIKKCKNGGEGTLQNPTYLDIELDDEQILGAHLIFEHGLFESNSFNENYEVNILAHVNPTTIRRTEQMFIQKLNTLFPYGLNQCNSVGD